MTKKNHLLFALLVMIIMSTNLSKSAFLLTSRKRRIFGGIQKYNRLSSSSLSASIDNDLINTSYSVENGRTTHHQQKGEEKYPEVNLFHPDDYQLAYPSHLSPSSVMLFKECPQAFLFQYLYKIKQPTNHALAKGSMCHSALEHIFDLNPNDRTIENLHNMFRAIWADHRLSEEYKSLFATNHPSLDHDGNNTTSNNNTNAMLGSTGNDHILLERDIDAEIEWGRSALQLLDNYYQSEDPRTIQRPNPHKREVWVNTNLTIDPKLGVTAVTKDNDTFVAQQQPETFKVRGIIDRIDMVRESSRTVALKIIDYKTGKAPNLKYSTSMNQLIFQKNFYQLKIYALLLREKNAVSASTTNSMDLRYLKLHYLNSENGRSLPWEMDLGETQTIRDESLNEVHHDLSQVWKNITSLVDKKDPKAFIHCDRPFCSCHDCRAQFIPGTVWDKERQNKQC